MNLFALIANSGGFFSTVGSILLIGAVVIGMWFAFFASAEAGERLEQPLNGTPSAKALNLVVYFFLPWLLAATSVLLLFQISDWIPKEPDSSFLQKLNWALAIASTIGWAYAAIGLVKWDVCGWGMALLLYPGMIFVPVITFSNLPEGWQFLALPIHTTLIFVIGAIGYNSKANQEMRIAMSLG